MPGQAAMHHFSHGQEAAHLWYHDHAMGITRLNVYAGLIGNYLIRDEFDTGELGNPLGLPAEEFEIPLILQEKIFTPTGAQNGRSTILIRKDRGKAARWATSAWSTARCGRNCPWLGAFTASASSMRRRQVCGIFTSRT